MNVAPKLHYHRSGLISLDATERLDRQGIQATPIGEIGRDGHKHTFSFHARHPFAWQKVAPRKTDLVFVPSQPPTTITIAGHLGPIENLKHETQPENPWAIMIEGRTAWSCRRSLRASRWTTRATTSGSNSTRTGNSATDRILA
jgi:hypothetical protein